MQTDQRRLRERVLMGFEQNRATPGAPFDESHFLDLLQPAPVRKGMTRTGFSGLRCLDRFLYAQQIEHEVCFSLEYRESNRLLDAFVARLAELKASPRSSLASLHNQQQHGFGWGTLLILNLVEALICSVVLRFPPWLGIACVATLIALDVLVLRVYLQQGDHARLLLARLDAAAQEAAAQEAAAQEGGSDARRDR